MIGTSLGSYQLLDELGRGATGVVYRARAAVRTALVPRGGEVAVKILQHASPTEEGRLLRTAVATSRVDHPNVVRVLDLGVEQTSGGPRPYMVMELVEGRTLERFLAREGTVSEDLARDLALQAARGLQAIHAAGMVHRDLKPANLLLATDHTLKVMDLGIARIAEGTRVSMEGSFLGTAAYAAPEQFGADEDVDGRTDLYSLGVVLYEALSGRNPFLAGSAIATMHRHASLVPPPLRDSGVAVGELLSSIVLWLLRKDPSERPPEAETLVRSLESGILPESAQRAATMELASRGAPPEVIQGPVLRGRDAELQAISLLMESCFTGGAMGLMVRGEHGAGKSRFLQEVCALSRRERPEARVGRISGGDPEADLPLRGLADGLRSLLGPRARNGSAEIADEIRAATGAPADPLLTSVLAGDPDATAAWTPEGEKRLAAAASGLVQALARKGPLLIAVDDAHLLEEPSARVLCTLMRACGGAPLMLVATGATREEGGSAHPAARWLDPDARPPRFPRFEGRDLPHLRPVELRELAAEVLGAPPEFALAECIVTAAGGCPGRLLAILEPLLRGDGVRIIDGRAVVASSLLSSLASALVEDPEPVLQRMQESDRAVLEMASVLGDGFTADEVTEALHLPRLSVLEALSRIEKRMGILSFSSGRYRFRRASQARAVRGSIHPDLRMELHSLAAETLRGRDSGPAVVRRCLHSLEGRCVELGLADLPMALREGWGILTPEAGLRFVDRGLDVLRTRPSADPHGALRARLFARRSDLLLTLGNVREAEDALGRAREAAGASPELQLVVETERLGSLPPRREIRGVAIGLIALYRRAHRPGGIEGGDVASRLAFLLAATGHHRWAVRWAAQAERLLTAAGDRVQAMRASVLRGRALRYSGNLEESAEVLSAAFEYGRREGNARLAALAGSELGGVLLNLGRYREALATAEAVEVSLPAFGCHRTDHLSLVAVASLGTGDYGRAVDALDEFSWTRASTGDDDGQARANRALLTTVMGTPAEARLAAEDSLTRLRRTGRPAQIAGALANLGNVLELEGAHDDAESVLDEALRTAALSARGVAACDAGGALARLRAARGAPDAGRFAAASLRNSRATGHRPSTADALLALAGLSAASGSRDVDGLVREAHALIVGEDLEPFYLLQLHACLAGLLTRMGRPEAAADVRGSLDARVRRSASTLPGEQDRMRLLAAVDRFMEGYRHSLAFRPASASPAGNATLTARESR